VDSFEKIGAGFPIALETLHKCTLEVATAIHKPLVERFIRTIVRAQFAVREDFQIVGLSPTRRSSFEVAQLELSRSGVKYFAMKHRIDFSKSQVIADRSGVAVVVAAGVTGAVHDMQLFPTHIYKLEQLIEWHDAESVKILADKGYIGPTWSNQVILVTLNEQPRNGQ
jgi:hypothetical protein